MIPSIRHLLARPRRWGSEEYTFTLHSMLILKQAYIVSISVMAGMFGHSRAGQQLTPRTEVDIDYILHKDAVAVIVSTSAHISFNPPLTVLQTGAAQVPSLLPLRVV